MNGCRAFTEDEFKKIVESISSKDKYILAGCGWLLFKKALNSKNILYKEDWSMGFKRYEVLCRNCESHLGHLFNDGPPPKKFRYTINSLSLVFIEAIPYSQIHGK